MVVGEAEDVALLQLDVDLVLLAVPLVLSLSSGLGTNLILDNFNKISPVTKMEDGRDS